MFLRNPENYKCVSYFWIHRATVDSWTDDKIKDVDSPYRTYRGL